MLRNALLNIMIFALSINFAYAQNQFPSEIKLKQYQQEKVFAHTDKSAYIAGEILWFKLYLVDANSNHPGKLSSFAYVEVLNSSQQAVLQTKVPLKNGSGSGSLYLPSSITAGNYTIKAYTAWMRNFAPELYFEKVITIANNLTETEILKPTAQLKINLQFFPEGGTLISGIQSKIAFKAVNENGDGVDFTAEILNAAKQTVATLKPHKFGMGHFIFTPNADEKYQVKIKNIQGKEELTPFFPVATQGYTLAIDSSTNNENIKVEVKSSANRSTEVYLLAHTRSQTKSIQKGELVNGVATFFIASNKLGDGISHFTLLDSEMKPVCERLYFKYPKQKLLITVNDQKSLYSTRDQVGLNIKTENETKNAVNADLSVSVFLLDSQAKHSQTDIFSYMWLSSDLKGNIEHPEYYFENDHDDRKQALENLLLTQGWRTFKGDDALENQAIKMEFQPETKTHIIHAKAFHKSTNLPASNVLAMLSVAGSNTHFYSAKSDSSGLIAFHTKNIYGPVQIALQAKDSLYRLALIDEFSNKHSFSPQPSFHAVLKSQRSLQAQILNTQIQNVYHSSKLNRFIVAGKDSTAFYGSALDKSYQFDLYTRFPNMEDVMREYVPEISVKKNKSNFQLTVYNVQEKYYLDEQPLILLDGIPVPDQDILMRYSPLKVQNMNIVSKRYFVGPLSFGGIIDLRSYKKDVNTFELNPATVLVDYEGLQLQREFYSPSYQTAEAKSSRLPDFRNLLYWSPSVKTDQNGLGKIEFYTSDQKGKYLMIIQGISEDGRFGYKQLSFEVQ